MKLSKIVMDYREKMQISQREFSRRCGLSNSYISFIENEFNPRTKKPIVPTIIQYKKIADCMGISLQELFEMLDGDAPVDISPAITSDLTEEEEQLIALWRGAFSDARRFALEILANHQKKDTSSKAE